MPGTDSNSGRCSLLYHLLNSCTCWVSISTYTMKIPRPFFAMLPSPLLSIAAIILPGLVGTRSSRLGSGRDTRHRLGSHLSLDGNDRDATRKSIGAGARPRLYQLQPLRQGLAGTFANIPETLHSTEPSGLAR